MKQCAVVIVGLMGTGHILAPGTLDVDWVVLGMKIISHFSRNSYGLNLYL